MHRIGFEGASLGPLVPGVHEHERIAAVEPAELGAKLVREKGGVATGEYRRASFQVARRIVPAGTDPGNLIPVKARGRQILRARDTDHGIPPSCLTAVRAREFLRE